MTSERPRRTAARATVAVLAAFGVFSGAVLAGAAPAGASADTSVPVAPGVRYEWRDVAVAQGAARIHVLSVDLRDPRVAVDLLHPGKVAARDTVSRMADAQGAVAGVNGDFFNITETQHPGVEATGASVGPAIAHGLPLKGAVPDGQRFGPALPPGTTTEDVLGVGRDGRARLDRLTLRGTVSAGADRLPLGGLNQYALPVGSVGAYDKEWGSVSRLRATCGTDTNRAAPCSAETYEVTVRGGRVVAVAERPGGGEIPAGTTVLVGREAGAHRLREVAVGERVEVRYRLVPSVARQPYRMAVGGYPVLRDGLPLPGLDDRTAAVRTAAGIADAGRRLLLVCVDGSPGRAGLTVAEVAGFLRGVGALDGFNLDGGGSSALVAREPGAGAVVVRNRPAGSAERPVANGIGIHSAAGGS
ncbi:phosphodiester glycosidase family protein [Streptomyces sp. NPDC088789]|uniref:phosphodiester glycosidase family protein n=1 Tax=Streptomyces sp. NPDC088789 TaxID=3365899 RepID=UPI0037FF5FC1